MIQSIVKIASTLFLPLLTGLAHSQTKDSLAFNPESYTVQTLTVEDRTFQVRAYEGIVYVKRPVDTAYQVLNIYIQEAYFLGKSINGYTAATAPIFFPNQIGGYMPAKPATALGGRPGPGGNNQLSTVAVALSQGYVVASAGARGRTTKDKNGNYTGKAPAAIVDLKAAVRYLKYNDGKMPGNAGKIVSNGTSAGGAMSALVGATGNNIDYDPYLKALGAAAASDDIFAVSAYCPITNLDQADMAYEWQFYGINSYKNGGPMATPGQGAQRLTSEQIAVSKDLKNAFPAYVNSLQLKDQNGNLLTLDENGNGSFKDWVKSYVIASAQKAVNSGQDLSVHQWLTISNGKVVNLDWDQYIVYMERQKAPPAFDALDLSTPETQVFGTEKKDKQHFSQYSQDHSTMADATIANPHIVKLMNPMYYIGAANTQTSKYWRIRHGSKDKDTGLGISVILGTLLQNKGYDVNLELPWNKPHSGDYDLTELFGWIDNICK